MKNINQARHIALSPNTKKQINKFKQEMSEEFSFHWKDKKGIKQH